MQSVNFSDMFAGFFAFLDLHVRGFPKIEEVVIGIQIFPQDYEIRGEVSPD